MSQINAEVQKLEPSAIVSLFTLDATRIGVGILRFTEGAQTGASVTYAGNLYNAVDVMFRGLDYSGSGAPSRPTISISMTNPVVQAIFNSAGDLNGCKLMRIRTFARFLDGQPDADPMAFYGPDIFEIDRKVADNNTEITWELASSFDQEGVMLPRRVMVRDTCLWRYRSYDAAIGQFDYSKAQCPYAGSQYFDANDNPVTDPAQDRPSRRLSCCKKRFGENAPLPFGGFPGIGRI